MKKIICILISAFALLSINTKAQEPIKPIVSYGQHYFNIKPVSLQGSRVEVVVLITAFKKLSDSTTTVDYQLFAEDTSVSKGGLFAAYPAKKVVYKNTDFTTFFPAYPEIEAKVESLESIVILTEATNIRTQPTR